MKCRYPGAKFADGASRVCDRLLEKHRHDPSMPDPQVLATAMGLDLLLALAQDDVAAPKSEWPTIGLDPLKSLLNIERVEIHVDATLHSAQDVIDRAVALAFSESPQFDNGGSPCESSVARRHLLAACIECMPEACQMLLEIPGEPQDIVKKLIVPWNQCQPAGPAGPDGNVPMLPFTVPNPAAFPGTFQGGPQPNREFLELCFKVMAVFPPDTFEADCSDYILSIADKFWSAACKKNQPAQLTESPDQTAPAI